MILQNFDGLVYCVANLYAVPNTERRRESIAMIGCIAQVTLDKSWERFRGGFRRNEQDEAGLTSTIAAFPPCLLNSARGARS